MQTIRRSSLLLTLGIVLTVFLVACGGTGSTTNTTSSSMQAASSSAKATTTPQPGNDALIQKTNAQTNSQQATGNANQAGNNQATDNQASNNKQAQTTVQKQPSQANNQNKQNDQHTQNGPDDNQASSGAATHDQIVVNASSVNVNGQATTVLTFDGMTLYEYASDQTMASNCTGQCAQKWPPLLSNAVINGGFMGKLSVQKTQNGNQVEYNGHPLYMYSGDNATGQANGQGVSSAWQVATAQLSRGKW